jgi:DNA-binding transcriptional LysR family regulator
MMVSVAGLRAIDALATHGSITAAAAALGYTPSAVSQQITRLERDVHQSLVERQGRRVTLTLAGRILAESASRIIIELESMSAELQAQHELVTGTLTLAAFPTAARGIVPTAMGELLRKWPTVELRLTEVDSHQAMTLVARGAVDLAVAHDWRGVPLELPEGLESRHLGNDVSDVLVPATHPLAAQPSVEFDDLRSDTWLFEPGSVAHDYLVHAYRREPAPLLTGHTISEYATQIALVGAGLGVALVPRMGRGTLPDSVRALSVRSGPVRRVYGVWRSSVSRRPALAAALDVLQAACSALEGDRL